MNYKSLIPISIYLLFALLFVLSLDGFALGLAIDTEDLIERAEGIVIGKVISKNGQFMDWTSRNTADNSVVTLKELMTEYEIEVSKIIKGEVNSETVGFFGFGGEADGKTTTWSFGFNFELDDHLLVFLRRQQLMGVWIVVGQSQGVFKLKKTNNSLEIISSNKDALITSGGNNTVAEHKQKQRRDLEELISRDEN